MTIVYVLTNINHGIIAYNQNIDKILDLYNEETDNGKCAGYTIKKADIDRPINLDKINDRLYLTRLIYEK